MDAFCELLPEDLLWVDDPDTHEHLRVTPGELFRSVRARCRASRRISSKARMNLLPPKAGAVLEAVLYRGELPRGEVAGIPGLTPRHARRIVS
jgi:hypothetical protein